MIWNVLDPNLLLWKNQGESFLSRLQVWVNLLDPALLLFTERDIRRARNLIESGGKVSEKDGPAVNLSLACVHPDSGSILAPVFRPPAFFPMSMPLVVASFLPHTKVHFALMWQFMVHTYIAGFNHANRNSSSRQGRRTSSRQLMLMAGTVSCTTFAAAFPQVIINRTRAKSTALRMFCRSILPIPMSAVLAAFSVIVIRDQETENGIRLFDSNGTSVGFSKAAGKKAVKETALSRAALFGVTAAVPQFLFFLLQRTRRFQRSPLLIGYIHYFSIALVFGLMTPVSFSLFPQLGTIKKEEVEKGLQVAADGPLYYHRGL